MQSKRSDHLCRPSVRWGCMADASFLRTTGAYRQAPPWSRETLGTDTRLPDRTDRMGLPSRLSQSTTRVSTFQLEALQFSTLDDTSPKPIDKWHTMGHNDVANANRSIAVDRASGGGQTTTIQSMPAVPKSIGVGRHFCFSATPGSPHPSTWPANHRDYSWSVAPSFEGGDAKRHTLRSEEDLEYGPHGWSFQTKRWA